MKPYKEQQIHYVLEVDLQPTDKIISLLILIVMSSQPLYRVSQ